MVVSEIGEQWSPNTEPAKIADSAVTVNSGAAVSQTETMMGIRMPKVPQEVPVAKESMADTPNIMAGISITGILDAATTPAT